MSCLDHHKIYYGGLRMDLTNEYYYDRMYLVSEKYRLCKLPIVPTAITVYVKLT